MGSLKDWAAGDGCFSKHRTSFCKTGFDSRTWRPQVPAGRQAGLEALFVRKRVLGNSGTKPGTELALAAGGLGKRARARMSRQWPECRASPSSAWRVQGIPGLLSRWSRLSRVCGRCCWVSRLSWWPTGSPDPCWGMKRVKPESETQNPRGGQGRAAAQCPLASAQGLRSSGRMMASARHYAGHLTVAL